LAVSLHLKSLAIGRLNRAVLFPYHHHLPGCAFSLGFSEYRFMAIAIAITVAFSFF